MPSMVPNYNEEMEYWHRVVQVPEWIAHNLFALMHNLHPVLQAYDCLPYHGFSNRGILALGIIRDSSAVAFYLRAPVSLYFLLTKELAQYVEERLSEQVEIGFDNRDEDQRLLVEAIEDMGGFYSPDDL